MKPLVISNSDSTLAAAAIAASIARFQEPVIIQLVACPFRTLTGLPCPGCGSKRAWTALMHGNLEGAVDANPFALVLCCVLLLLITWRMVSLLTSWITPPDVGAIAVHAIPKSFVALWIIWAIHRAWAM